MKYPEIKEIRKQYHDDLGYKDIKGAWTTIKSSAKLKKYFNSIFDNVIHVWEYGHVECKSGSQDYDLIFILTTKKILVLNGGEFYNSVEKFDL